MDSFEAASCGYQLVQALPVPGKKVLLLGLRGVSGV